jgi:hypothetical protein
MLRYSSCLSLNTFNQCDGPVRCPDTTASDWTLDSEAAVAVQVEKLLRDSERLCGWKSPSDRSLLNICKSCVECSLTLLCKVFLKRAVFNKFQNIFRDYFWANVFCTYCTSRSVWGLISDVCSNSETWWSGKWKLTDESIATDRNRNKTGH